MKRWHLVLTKLTENISRTSTPPLKGYAAYAREWVLGSLLAENRTAKRKDQPWMSYLKQQVRKMIETHFSCIKARMPRSIHAVTANGFYLKTALFIIAYTFEAIVA